MKQALHNCKRPLQRAKKAILAAFSLSRSCRGVPDPQILLINNPRLNALA
jgi:hypothetical protein